MKLILRFELAFESDWHINAGYGFGSQIDSVLERDPDGVSVIKGSTLKGLFRDALYDLAGHMGSTFLQKNGLLANINRPEYLPEVLLGSPGHDSPWIFDMARPAQTLRLTNQRLKIGVDDAIIASGVRVNPRTKRAEDNKFFQRELGKAQPFEFTVTGNVRESEALEHVEWLVAAASWITSLGGRRRRGTGQCQIRLINAFSLHEQFLTAFETRYTSEPYESQPFTHLLDPLRANTDKVQLSAYSGYRYRILVHAQSPIIISEKPEAGNAFSGQTLIPGQTLRGALAAVVNPDPSKPSAYEQFTSLFIFGGAAFSDLYPLIVDQAGTQGYPLVDVPLGLQRPGQDKLVPFVSVFDKIIDQKMYQGDHVLADGFPSIPPEYAYQTQKQTHMHVKIDPQLKRAEDGNLYSYDAMPTGIYYVGEIYLADGNWSAFGSVLNVDIQTPFELHIGKGRNRGYGRCLAWIEPIESVTQAPVWISMPIENRVRINEGPISDLVITLGSDMILIDKWGRAIQGFDIEILASILGLDESAIASYHPMVQSKIVDGFDTLAGLPRWRDMALVRGSSVKITFDQPYTFDLAGLRELEVGGFGLRRSEGFGRVIFNHPAHLTQFYGFASPVIIPEALQLVTHAELSVSDFHRQWTDRLQDSWNILVPADTALEAQEVNRTIARRLIQDRPENVRAALDLINSLGSAVEKRNRFARQKRTLNELITALGTYPEKHWRRGLTLLAETLLKVK